MLTLLLLIASNIFMTLAWYGHLKYRSMPLLTVIFASGLIAFMEYCLQVPANRLGYGQFTAYQLKILQEIVTLVVFMGFAYLYLGEALRWNYALALLCILAGRRAGLLGQAVAPLASTPALPSRNDPNAPFYRAGTHTPPVEWTSPSRP